MKLALCNLRRVVHGYNAVKLNKRQISYISYQTCSPLFSL